ncbi:MAG: four helix bundle protein [Bacteroidota bacterium]|nr:four helix bundle protein [Bacteroidota bacterium]
MKIDLIKRTKNFAYSCIDLSMKLPNSYLGNHVKGQLIRSSSSVAANYRATCHAQSKPAFIAKISIVVEECDESEFWLQLILDKELINKEEVIPVLKEGNELTSIFVVSRKTASMNLKVN